MVFWVQNGQRKKTIAHCKMWPKMENNNKTKSKFVSLNLIFPPFSGSFNVIKLFKSNRVKRTQRDKIL